ncbi:glycosyltransferase family 2 protein [Halosimplex aquaticum]
MSSPQVSVIIPTYNRATLVKRAIQSVLNQTFKDFELIIVDDASDDETPEVIDSINDARLEYIRHDLNRHGGAARNTGIKYASGKYIAFLDDDDEWYPTKLERQVERFETVSNEIGSFIAGARYIRTVS